MPIKSKKKTISKPFKAEKVKAVKPKLTERQLFHRFFHDVYLKDADLSAPHHADKHGMLGYENNVFTHEIHGQNGYEQVEVNGLCAYCTKDRPSASEEWSKR